ncbi:MAG: cell envelope integrity protein TolA [Chromatiales bacterium]|nr:MAG: cell envelope integrity protein TolA [Chromatiales bacterium]
MIRDNRNIIPVFMAVLLHIIIFGSMVVAIDFARPKPLTPLTVQATLVQETPDTRPPPPPVEEPKPEPAPEPEPDNSAELQREAEEEKRRQDALLEEKRLEELKRQEEEDRKRREREEEERKQREEEEKERQRVEAERKRQEDIQRQREENERLLREMEAEERQAEIDAEADRLAAVNSGQLAVYIAMISQKVQRNLSLPASAPDDLLCNVRVRQARNGDVLGVRFLDCNGDDVVKRSIEAAIFKSSPLPQPPEPNLFDPNLRFPVTKQQ